jgi:hypothetical protein
MCSKCEAIEDLNIVCARVAHLFTCSGRNTQESLLITSGRSEHSRISFVLFRIIMVDTIQSFVQKVSGTVLDIVYLTAVFELNLFNNIR